MSRHVELGVHPDELPPKLGSLGLQSRDLPPEVVPLETGNGPAIRGRLAAGLEPLQHLGVGTHLLRDLLNSRRQC
jgi:hypothetical protein